MPWGSRSPRCLPSTLNLKSIIGTIVLSTFRARRMCSNKNGLYGVGGGGQGSRT